jgi:hypothetical protein
MDVKQSVTVSKHHLVKWLSFFIGGFGETVISVIEFKEFAVRAPTRPFSDWDGLCGCIAGTHNYAFLHTAPHPSQGNAAESTFSNLL